MWNLSLGFMTDHMRLEDDITELTPDMEELKEKKFSSQKLRIYDSDLEESNSIPGRQNGHKSKV